MLQNYFMNIIFSISTLNSTVPIIEVCDPDIAAAEIFDDAPAEIRITKNDNEKLCKLIFVKHWCWMDGNEKQTCCEREVNTSGGSICCELNSMGGVKCYTAPKPKDGCSEETLTCG